MDTRQHYVNIESPPSMHPCKRICDITGYETGFKDLDFFVTLVELDFSVPHYDPKTNLRYANTDVFKTIRSLPNDYVQRYLSLRNAAVVLK
ncbi:hypothetical protein TSUD_147670 [Trifolium subterraneum]|uniref:Vps72/YL1 C-terminal domain-containing protein n=1 Tax=Trifolium subterraneum TaxID=3900 RepID=A0A2Z6NTH9_TRISU|nr:hypothetical protein TSUD_147670 [Trifolium subterraneum]